MSHTGVLHNVSHRGGTHKADGVNARVGEDVAHQVAVTSNYVEQTVGQAGLLVEASYEVRGAGNRGGYLEDEGVTGGQGYRVHPQWHHGREVEGANASDDADRLTHGVYVYTAGGLVGEFTLESSVNAAHKVHSFATTGNLTQGVTVSLAAFAHDNVGQLVSVLDHELTELEHNVYALSQGNAGPLGLGSFGYLNYMVQVFFAGHE